MSLKDDCECGHDRSSHYYDPITKTYECCLAMRCDDCTHFRKPGSTKRIPPRPANHPAACQCFYCKQHPQPARVVVDDDDAPETDPMPKYPGFWPMGFP